jgi:voltage-gated potassium channel
MAILTVASLALVVVADQTEDESRLHTLFVVDFALVLVFLCDWVYHLWKAPRRLRWALAHSWELLGMVPLALPIPPELRLLRLTRLTRLLRLFGTLGRLFGVWERISKDGHLPQIAAVSSAITVLGALLAWLVERDSNPQFAEFGNSLWWAMVTVCTVGYGDIVPQTTAGRLVGGVLMVTGIGTIGLLASSLAGVFVRRAQKGDTMAGELERVAQLHSQGKLTDDEFARAKRKLLA